MEKKILEANEEIDQFLESNEIEPGSLMQRIEFVKTLYERKEQVQDFLKAHYLDGMEITEDDKAYYASMFDEMGFIESTMKTVEIRDGISIVVGILREMTPDNPFYYNLQDESVKLSENLPSVIELAQVVTGFHARYGEVKLTKGDLKSFKDNFEKKSYGIDISIDFDHETREAAGWVKEVFLSEDGTKLYGVVKWTPKGALALNDREFRYFSPEFNLNFIHPHTGINHGPTLFGGGLVNRPFLKMDAIVGLKDKHLKGDPQMETISLSDHKAKVNEFEKQISDLRLSENTLKSETQSLKDDNTKLGDELKTLKAEIVKKEVQDKHQKLFDEGKINKAQLVALNEGKDLLDVLSLSEKMNTQAQGSGEGTQQVQLSEAEKQICKKMGLSEEDYIKYNKVGE